MVQVNEGSPKWQVAENETRVRHGYEHNDRSWNINGEKNNQAPPIWNKIYNENASRCCDNLHQDA